MHSDASYCLLPNLRYGVRFELQDIRSTMPEGSFDVILCRNMTFTYFDEAMQRRPLKRMTERLFSGGYLVLGAHETLPASDVVLAPIQHGLPIYRQEDRRQ